MTNKILQNFTVFILSTLKKTKTLNNFIPRRVIGQEKFCAERTLENPAGRRLAGCLVTILFF